MYGQNSGAAITGRAYVVGSRSRRRRSMASCAGSRQGKINAHLNLFSLCLLEARESQRETVNESTPTPGLGVELHLSDARLERRSRTTACAESIFDREKNTRKIRAPKGAHLVPDVVGHGVQ